MEYLVVVHRDRPDGPCGVTVPDLPGCFSAGDTLAEALANAREAIALYVEDVLESAEPVAEPSTEIDPDGGIVAAVPLDDGLLSEKAIRVSVPESETNERGARPAASPCGGGPVRRPSGGRGRRTS